MDYRKRVPLTSLLEDLGKVHPEIGIVTGVYLGGWAKLLN